MYLNIREHEEARDYKVVEKETGKTINDVVWADDEKGIYGKLKRRKDGSFVLNKQHEAIITEVVKGNIKLVKVNST